jgi:glycosyltransferase involved in cell wall biosynthesis
MAEPRISVLIVARDEAPNLPGCLQSVAWADERVVVVDRASRDQTQTIAERSAEVVAVRSFDDFAGQRNAALALATGDWVCAIDADERASPELAAEIRQVTGAAERDPALGFSGFRVPIRSVILGRTFRFSGTQCDLPLRVFRRGAGHWTGAVHETVELSGRAGRLRNALQHETITDIHTFLKKIDEYTTLEATRFAREWRSLGPLDLAMGPLWKFIKLYFGKQGFRDGREGFVFCTLSGVSELIRHWKSCEHRGGTATQGNRRLAGSHRRVLPAAGMAARAEETSS